jgi:uncharacterized Tic20 family protein
MDKLDDKMEKDNVTQERHKSSIGDFDANIVVLMVWLGPIILGLVFSTVHYLGIIVPLIFLLLEKKSNLVRNHAGQSLTLSIVTVALQFLFSFLSVLIIGGAYYTASPDGLVDVGRLTGLGIGGFLILIPRLIQLVFIIIGCVKGWNWRLYYLPLVGRLGNWFTKTVRLK